jgi:hypothetical protein
VSSLFGSKKPAPEPLPMGTPTHRLSSNESARPVPYLAGRQRLGLTFISEVFNQRADAVVANFGKKKTVSGYNYFGSFLTLIGGGPFDALHDLIYNGDSVYTEATPIYASSLTFDSGTGLATFGTAAPHGQVTGTGVVIKGAVQGDYNGPTTITVTDANHFTYPVIGSPASPATGTVYALVTLDAVERGVETEVEILVPNFGPILLQWGTEAQTTPTKMNLSGTVHPSQRGCGRIFFDQTFLGFNQTNVQNLEGVFSRFPQQDWLELDPIEGECNPIAFICDILQNARFGLRVATTKIDTVTMLATGAQLYAEGLGFSPLILRQQTAMQLLLEALEYIDGYFTINGSGQLGVKLARGPSDDLPEITDADLTARAEFAAEDWSTVKTGCTVIFTNRDVGYNKDASKPYKDSAALSIKGEPDHLTLERPWFTRKAVANAFAISAGRMQALPQLPGRLKLRQRGTLFNDLLPGALFRMNISTRSLPYTIFRVTDRTLPNPARPEFEIAFRADRSYLHAPIA